VLPAVICTIWSGHIHDCMEDRLAPLRRLGFERIALFGHLAWRYPQHLLPHYCMDLPEKVLPEADAIRQAFALLGDESSRRLFVNHVAWRLHLDHDLLPVSSSLQIYFDPHFSTDCADEVVFDLGAFNGDTLEGYLATGRGYREYHCFEPVARNFAALRDSLERQARPGLYAHRLAVGDSNGEVLIEAANGPSSRVGLGDERVPMTTLDDLTSQGLPPTFIKIDIEGFEPQCLAGGHRLIAERRPVIAVTFTTSRTTSGASSCNCTATAMAIASACALMSVTAGIWCSMPYLPIAFPLSPIESNDSCVLPTTFSSSSPDRVSGMCSSCRVAGRCT